MITMKIPFHKIYKAFCLDKFDISSTSGLEHFLLNAEHGLHVSYEEEGASGIEEIGIPKKVVDFALSFPGVQTDHSEILAKFLLSKDMFYSVPTKKLKKKKKKQEVLYEESLSQSVGTMYIKQQDGSLQEVGNVSNLEVSNNPNQDSVFSASMSLDLDHVVSLKEAKGIGQVVYGTDNDSRYITVGMNSHYTVAARIKESSAGLSLRVSVNTDNPSMHVLVAFGLSSKQSGSYYSGHFDMKKLSGSDSGGVSSVSRRVIGALLCELRIPVGSVDIKRILEQSV